jgi:hypothetical protein
MIPENFLFEEIKSGPVPVGSYFICTDSLTGNISMDKIKFDRTEERANFYRDREIKYYRLVPRTGQPTEHKLTSLAHD